jgi:hypothetical protein
VKELAQSRYGHKIVLKHLPDCHFMMNDDIYKRLLKRFEVELGLWDALEGTHLMMIGTFSIGATGVASLEEVALMCVTENWIPFESTFEKMALDALTQQNRRFMKGMRYNLPSTRPLACAVASDTEPEPTAMYVVPPGASEDYAAAVDELIAESKLPSWKWVAGEALCRRCRHCRSTADDERPTPLRRHSPDRRPDFRARKSAGDSTRNTMGASACSRGPVLMLDIDGVLHPGQSGTLIYLPCWRRGCERIPMLMW